MELIFFYNKLINKTLIKYLKSIIYIYKNNKFILLCFKLKNIFM